MIREEIDDLLTVLASMDPWEDEISLSPGEREYLVKLIEKDLIVSV